MNIKHFPFHLSLSFTFALALITCQTSQPAFAQSFNQQTDNTTNILTTGDITGGTFYPNSTGNNQGGTFPYSVTRGRFIKGAVFANSSTQAAVNNAALAVISNLSTNSLNSPTGQPIPSQTQQNLRSLLTSSSECVPSTDDNRGQSTDASNRDNTNACTGQITGALSNVEGNPGLDRVQQLANRLEGLLKTNSSQTTELANGRVDPIRLVEVVNAYNDLIDNSSAEFLNNPPPELLAIQSVLLQLVNSVIADNK
jgi:hypothetical protein